MKFVKKFKEHVKRVLEEKHTPLSIAVGFSLGTFIAALPTFGVGLLIGLFLVSIFSRLNKYSMLASFAIWNPLVLAPIHGFSYQLGVKIIPNIPTKIIGFKFFDEFYRYTIQYLVGNFILSLSVAIISFIVTYLLSYFYYKKKETLLEYLHTHKEMEEG